MFDRTRSSIRQIDEEDFSMLGSVIERVERFGRFVGFAAETVAAMPGVLLRRPGDVAPPVRAGGLGGLAGRRRGGDERRPGDLVAGPSAPGGLWRRGEPAERPVGGGAGRDRAGPGQPARRRSDGGGPRSRAGLDDDDRGGRRPRGPRRPDDRLAGRPPGHRLRGGRPLAHDPARRLRLARRPRGGAGSAARSRPRRSSGGPWTSSASPT